MLILPTVHLNGTSKKELFDTYFEALDAIAVARVALTKAYPNGRDYYIQGPLAINQAMSQHADRLQRLETIYDELHAIAEHVQP
jgi:hypothetical protein